MMKILVTDGMERNAIEILKNEGFEVEEQFYEKEGLKKKIKEIDIIVVRSATKIREELIDEAIKTGRLKMIIRGGVGLDNIDVNYAQKKGIIVRNTPIASSNAVAELVLCEILVLARKVKVANLKLRNGVWDKKNLKGMEIAGKTLGLVGFGNIAKSLANKAYNLGMKVVYNDILDIKDDRFEFVSFEELLANSDFITVHTPLTEATRYMFNKEVFEQMKKTAFLINCARGGIVNERDLLRALENEEIAGAALDCFENEPKPLRELIENPRVSVTPHIGGSTLEAQERIGMEIANIIMEGF